MDRPSASENEALDQTLLQSRWAHAHLQRQTMPILPWRFHTLVRQALAGHLSEMQDVPNLIQYVIACGVAYVLGDRRHVIERLDAVYLHLDSGALPYLDTPELPAFDLHVVRRPTPEANVATQLLKKKLNNRAD